MRDVAALKRYSPIIVSNLFAINKQKATPPEFENEFDASVFRRLGWRLFFKKIKVGTKVNESGDDSTHSRSRLYSLCC